MSVLCILAETPRAVYADEAGTAILEPVLRTPWGAMRDMMFFAAPAPAWEPLDEARLAPEVLRRHGHLAFRTGDEPSIEAQVQNISRLTAGLYVPEARFGAGGRERARAALHELLARLPASAAGSIFVDAIGERHLAAPWFARHGIAPLTEPFVGLPWLVALPLAEHRDALTFPGVVVEERDGRAWIQLYDDPFAYDTSATRQRVAAISAHQKRVSSRRSPA